MSTLVIRHTARPAPAAPQTVDAPVGPFRALTRRVRRSLDFSFSLDGADLCDAASVHADLVEHFERREA